MIPSWEREKLGSRVKLLPPRAQIAVKVRVAQIIFPLLGTERSFAAVWPQSEHAAEAHVDALHRVLEFARRYSLGIADDAYVSHLDLARSAASSATGVAKDAAKAACNAAETAIASQGVDDLAHRADIYIFGAYYAADAALGDPADAAIEASKDDIHYLETHFSPDPSEDELNALIQNLYRRPLWRRETAGRTTFRPPQVFTDWALPRFQIACEGIQRLDLYKHYIALIEGGAPAEPAETADTPTEEPAKAEAAAQTGSDGPATTVADQPAEKDRLGRQPLAQALAALFLHREQGTPMTVALFGDWGSGKSTLMRLIRQEMEKRLTRAEEASMRGTETAREVYHATFNAWTYEQMDCIRAALAHEVVHGLTAHCSTLGRLLISVRLTLRKLYPALRVFVLLSPLIAALMMVFWDGFNRLANDVWNWMTSNPVAEGALTLGSAGFIGYLLYRLWHLLRHPIAVNLATYLRLPDYRRDLGSVARIREQLAGLTRILLQTHTSSWSWFRRKLCDFWCGMSKLIVARRDTCKRSKRSNNREAKPRQKPEKNFPKKRLVVWIDDLDRCAPDKIMEVFEASRLIMDLPGVITVFLVDPRIAFAAVTKRFEQQQPKMTDMQPQALARDYLGKIIQLPVTLGPPDSVDTYVKEALFAPHLVEKPVQQDGSAGATDREQAAVGVPKPVTVETSDNAGSAGTPPLQKSPKAADSGPETESLRGQDDEKIREQLTHSDREQQVFYELTSAYRFDNPRQLLRLFNSYRLLKSWQAGLRSHEEVDPLALMGGLFGLEAAMAAEVQKEEKEAIADGLKKLRKILLDIDEATASHIGHLLKNSEGEAFQHLQRLIASVILRSDTALARPEDPPADA